MEQLPWAAPPVPKTKACPFCKSEVPLDASICRFCTKGISTGHLVGQGLTALGMIGTLLVTIPVLLLLALGYCGR